MNIKDVTTTTFGLIVAYLLPGVAGLYTISLYARGARHLFAPWRSREHLGGAELGDHRVEPGRRGAVLRAGER